MQSRRLAFAVRKLSQPSAARWLAIPVNSKQDQGFSHPQTVLDRLRIHPRQKKPVINTLPLCDDFPLPRGRWQVSRSTFGGLPVHVTLKHARSKIVTTIRRIHGDTQAFIEDVLEVTQVQPENVRFKPGVVELKGHHERLVTEWLEAVEKHEIAEFEAAQ
ncbi:MAG: hypothetical protein MHM6MM_000847 [Cercozoa sp. M6MM]